jgi:hypothetical protein
MMASNFYSSFITFYFLNLLLIFGSTLSLTTSLFWATSVDAKMPTKNAHYGPSKPSSARKKRNLSKGNHSKQ